MLNLRQNVSRVSVSIMWYDHICRVCSEPELQRNHRIQHANMGKNPRHVPYMLNSEFFIHVSLETFTSDVCMCVFLPQATFSETKIQRTNFEILK